MFQIFSNGDKSIENDHPENDRNQLKAITEADSGKTKQEIVKELKIEYSIDICIKFENQKAWQMVVIQIEEKISLQNLSFF